MQTHRQNHRKRVLYVLTIHDRAFEIENSITFFLLSKACFLCIDADGHHVLTSVNALENKTFVLCHAQWCVFLLVTLTTFEHTLALTEMTTTFRDAKSVPRPIYNNRLSHTFVYDQSKAYILLIFRSVDHP